MGLFGGNAKREAVENEVMQKLAQVDLLDMLIQNLLAEAQGEKPWITDCQSYYDSCSRTVHIAPDTFAIRWTEVDSEEYVGKDGKRHTNQEEKEMGCIAYSYTKSGYLPLHNHCNEKGKEDVSVDKVCELWARVVQERMQAQMPKCRFTGSVTGEPGHVSFTYSVPRSVWKTWF